MGSSCSTLPRLCPACKTRTWHCMPGSNCCLEVLCTSRNLVYPEIPWVLPAELFLAYALGAREA